MRHARALGGAAEPVPPAIARRRTRGSLAILVGALLVGSCSGGAEPSPTSFADSLNEMTVAELTAILADPVAATDCDAHEESAVVEFLCRSYPEQAAEALGERGDPAAVPALVAALEDPDRPHGVEQASWAALEAIGGPDVITFLDEWVATNPTRSSEAAEILGRLRGPTPQPTPAPEVELIGACYGKPVPWAAPYAGKVHPLVIAGPWGVPGVWDWLPDFDINEKWRDDEWTSPMIQLVVCPESAEPKPGGSCGTYTRDDEVSGELIRYRDVLKVRVVVARTGKTLQSTTLLGPKTKCPASTGISLGKAPPWSFLADSVTFEQIDEYATRVSKQPVN